MARFNEILVGRYNRHFQKLLSMKGEPPAPQLASEIVPGLSLFSGVEERYLQGWNRNAVPDFVTGGAAQQAGIRLRNPKTSGVVAVLEQAYFYCVTNTVEVSVQQATTDVDLTTVVATTGNRMPDGRQSPTP